MPPPLVYDSTGWIVFGSPNPQRRVTWTHNDYCDARDLLQKYDVEGPGKTTQITMYYCDIDESFLGPLLQAARHLQHAPPLTSLSYCGIDAQSVPVVLRTFPPGSLNELRFIDPKEDCFEANVFDKETLTALVKIPLVRFHFGGILIFPKKTDESEPLYCGIVIDMPDPNCAQALSKANVLKSVKLVCFEDPDDDKLFDLLETILLQFKTVRTLECEFYREGGPPQFVTLPQVVLDALQKNTVLTELLFTPCTITHINTPTKRFVDGCLERNRALQKAMTFVLPEAEGNDAWENCINHLGAIAKYAIVKGNDEADPTPQDEADPAPQDEADPAPQDEADPTLPAVYRIVRDILAPNTSLVGHVGVDWQLAPDVATQVPRTIDLSWRLVPNTSLVTGQVGLDWLLVPVVATQEPCTIDMSWSLVPRQMP